MYDMFLPNIFLPNPSFLARCFVRPKGSHLTQSCLPAKTATDKLLPLETKSRQTSAFDESRTSCCATNHALDRSAQENLYKWLIVLSHPVNAAVMPLRRNPFNVMQPR